LAAKSWIKTIAHTHTNRHTVSNKIQCYRGPSIKQMKRYSRWLRQTEKYWTPLEVDKRDG